MEVEVGRCTCMGLRARFNRETRGGRGSPLYKGRLRLIDMDSAKTQCHLAAPVTWGGTVACHLPRLRALGGGHSNVPVPAPAHTYMMIHVMLAGRRADGKSHC